MKHCLIVDDSRVIRKIARKILEDLHFEANEAEDLSEALERCRAKMPDAVLLDCGLPSGSTTDFLRALRREPGGDKPIVVMCPIENDLSQFAEAVNAGADDYLTKPFDREILEAKFNEIGLMT